MKTKTLEILVVEDQVKHQVGAKAALPTKEQGVNTTYVSTLKELMESISSCHYDGIILDAFFPTGYETSDPEQDRRIREESLKQFVELITEYKNSETIKEVTEPILQKRCIDENIQRGLTVAEELKCLEIPFLGLTALTEIAKTSTPLVICTSAYHHAVGVEQIRRYAPAHNVPVVADGPGEMVRVGGICEYPAKKWNAAWYELKNLIKK